MKFLFVLLTCVFGGKCVPGITIEIPKQNGFIPYLVNATVNVLTSCYGKRVNAVSLYGTSTGILYTTLMSKEVFSAFSTEDTAEARKNGVEHRDSRYRLQLFTVACSSKQLPKILTDIKDSPWWNHMASFLILNWTPDEECSNAFDFLWAAWEMNLLNVNYLCVHRSKGVIIYTYNPYTSKAPSPWKLQSTFRGKDDHPWSMFVREYREGREICEGLDFDKTGDLGGYAIPSSTQELDTYWYTNGNKSGADSFEGLEGYVIKMAYRSMNADAKLATYGSEANYFVTVENGKSTGILLDIVNGVSDIVLPSWYQESLANMTITYPHWRAGLGVLTQYNDHMSQLSKINSVIDSSSRLGLLLVMLVTPVCFKYFFRQAIVPAILNTLRVTFNSPLPKLPKKRATRIYLATLFVFQITILALYQGQLSSLLTKPVYLKNVDTMNDLAHGGYTVYGHKTLRHFLYDPVLEDRFVTIDTFDCADYAMRDSSAACLSDWDILNSHETPTSLYKSKDGLLKMSLVYAVREDWPLEERFNKILARMVEADIVRHEFTKYSEKFMNIDKINAKARKEKSFKIISLNEISFAFTILAIGLGCATASFVIEFFVALGKKKKTIFLVTAKNRGFNQKKKIILSVKQKLDHLNYLN